MNAWAFPESDELGKASPDKKAYSLAFGAGYANACGRPLFDQLAPETENCSHQQRGWNPGNCFGIAMV